MFRQLFFSPSEKLLLHQIINLPPMTKPCLVFHIFAERPPIRGKPKHIKIQPIKIQIHFSRETFHSRKTKIQQINLQFCPTSLSGGKKKILVKELQLLSKNLSIWWLFHIHLHNWLPGKKVTRSLADKNIIWSPVETQYFDRKHLNIVCLKKKMAGNFF